MHSPHLSQFSGRHINSWYAASSPDPQPYAPLAPEQNLTEVCVIGGGFTGLSCALELAERGVQVTLLEGGLVGYGASGRNGGQILHGFACPLDLITRQLGTEAAQQCWQMSQQAVTDLGARIARHQIDCDLSWGALTTASTSRQFNHLRGVQQQLQQLNYANTRLLSAPQLLEQIDSPAYCGGLFDPGGGHLHPLRYAQGLALAARQAGAVIHEQTRATRITESNGQVCIHSDNGGQIQAQHLVLACNVDIGLLDSRLAQRFLPVISHIIATEPLPETLAQQLLPHNAAVCDSNHVLNYFRLSSDRRMLFGGRLKNASATPARIAEQRRHDMAHIFPALAHCRIDYSWGGAIDIGLNKAPQFGRINPKIYYAQGFAGHGVALTGLAGQLIAQAILQQSSGFDLFARIKAPYIPLHRFSAAALVRCGIAFYRLRDRLGV
jgi:gamma-glutamylputrescine oxidase